MKKNIILSLIIILVLVGVVFLLSNKKDKVDVNSSSQDWLIIPGESIGRLVKASLNKSNIVDEVKSIFGEGNVKETEFSVGEGVILPGFSIYPGTENEITFHFNENEIIFKLPGYNSYFKSELDLSSKIKWEMGNGIKIGSTLSDLEKINGKPFELSGFEWDYPGVVSTWLNGNLPSNLSVVFKPTAEVSVEESNEITGDKLITSNNPVLLKANPVVNFIYIKWDLR